MYIWGVKFTLSDIPHAYLDRLGLDREQIRQWPRQTREALLSGLRTSLVRLTDVRPLGAAAGKVLDARLSLFRKPDGAVGVNLHPAGNGRSADPILSAEERAHLRSGQASVIGKTVRDAAGREREALVGHDPATGSDVAVDRTSLRAPRSLDGQPLSEAQRRDFTEGRSVTLGERTYRFDPAREGGIAKGTTLTVSHSRVEDTDIAIDVALLASGLGSVILIEHMADMALHLRLQRDRHALGDPAFREALARAVRAQSSQPERRPSKAESQGTLPTSREPIPSQEPESTPTKGRSR